MSNLETVQSIYAAFGRGDVPAILARLSEEVEWEYGASITGVPWLEPRRGRDAVAGFFEALQDLEFRHFEPKTLLEDGDVVVSLIDVELVVRSTGRTIREEDEVHVWRFDGEGRVARFCHRVDSHQHWAAYRGE